MSVRLSTAFPRACSGLMYAGVPRILPSSVPIAVIVGALERSSSPSPAKAFANPKSSTFTRPSGVTFTLAGGLTGLGHAAAAASSETSPAITIHVRNYAGVAPQTLTEAEQVATGIFRKQGAEAGWDRSVA